MTKRQSYYEFRTGFCDEINKVISENDSESKKNHIKETYFRLLKENSNKEEVIDSIANIISTDMSCFIKESGYQIFGG